MVVFTELAVVPEGAVSHAAVHFEVNLSRALHSLFRLQHSSRDGENAA